MGSATASLVKGEIVNVMIKSSVTVELLVISVENESIFSAGRNTNAIIGVTLGWMEVEHEDHAGSIKRHHFISLMF